MNLGVDYSWVLWLLPLAIVPMFSSALGTSAHPHIQLIPRDGLSDGLDWLLRIIAVLTLLALLLGIAGLHRVAQTVQRIGKGAHIVLLLDRSSSMDHSFAGRAPAGGEESKATAARRLLAEFVSRRGDDLFGVAAFSSAPLFVLPMTGQREATLAAVRAMDRPGGLAFTNIAKGLALALSYFEGLALTGSRVILLVSDGAAEIGFSNQVKLRKWFQKHRTALYWIHLRTAGSPSIFDPPDDPADDTPAIRPERFLHRFFSSLKIPYQVYEAEDPKALEAAIADIGRLENKPLVYSEPIPRQDLTGGCYGVALALVGLLIMAKRVEVAI